MNWERGVGVREEMVDKAKLFFTKLRRNGGDVSDIPAEYFQQLDDEASAMHPEDES